MRLMTFTTVLALVGVVTVSTTGRSESDRPAVRVSTPNRVLQVKTDDLCSVDFANMSMFGWWSHPAKLTNGSYERKYQGGYNSVSLERTACFDSAQGYGKHAVVVTDWLSCGGSCSDTGIVQLFGIVGGSAVIRQQFQFDKQAPGTGVAFDKKSLELTITARSDEPSAHCCAKSVDVVTYKWTATGFTQENYRRVAVPRQ